VVAGTEGGIGAALPVFAASRSVAVDVEALRVGKVLLERVTDGGSDHDLRARPNPVTRELERVGGRPKHGGRDRMKPQGLHRHAARDIEPLQSLGGHAALIEEGVRLGGHALHQLWALDHVVDHERTRARRGVQSDHVGREHRQGQVGLGEKLGIGGAQLEHQVDEVRRSSARTHLALVCEDRPGQLAGPFARTAESREPHDVRNRRGAEEQSAQQRGQIARVALRRIARHHVAHLLGDHVLERRQRLERLPHRPLADLVAGDVDDLLRPVPHDPDRVSPGLGLPCRDVIDPVHGHDRTRRTHLVVEARHRLERPEDGLAVRGEEIGRLRPRDAHEPAPRSAYPEDRAQFAVLAGEEGHQSPPHGQAVAQHGKPRHHRDLFRLPGLRRRFIGSLETLDRQDHRPADQVEVLQQVDSITDLCALLGRQNGAEHAARVREGDDRDVARAGNVVAEQDPHDPQPGFLDPLPVRDRVAPGSGHRWGQRQHAVRFGPEDAAFGQAGQRGLADPAAPPCRPFQPVARVMRFTDTGDLGNLGERRVQDVVTEGRGVHEDQPLGIRVDTILEG